MILKHLLLATTVTLGLHAVPALAQEAAVDAMQEYMMFSEYEAGIILPQQIDRSNVVVMQTGFAGWQQDAAWKP